MQQFNNVSSYWMHIDLNSCFATIEQQANPLLRGKPIAVAAYATDYGCILAPSIEAKRYGIKTGMRVRDGKKLYPKLIVLPGNLAKYRFVNKQFQKLFMEYSPRMSVRSIDEMVLDFSGSLPVIARQRSNEAISLFDIGREIKTRIKAEIGDWLTVSIGISTNPYLAKLASGLHKPDGLDEINGKNILRILSKLKLIDLPYIKERNALRLNSVGIYTPVDFYFASAQKLKSAFQSISGAYWHRRLHGFSIDEEDFSQKTIGHSYHLPKFTSDRKQIEILLCKLVEKMGRRIRKDNLTAQGIHVGCLYVDGTYWHHGQTFPCKMYASHDLFCAACHILNSTELKPVRILSVSSFNLKKNAYTQMTLFNDENKKRSLTQALDAINNRWGEFAVTPGLMMGMDTIILDRIAFGRVDNV